MAGSGGHRSTLKQKNKSHNHGKHRSKRHTKREAHGKVSVKHQTKENKIKEVLRQEASQNQADGRKQMIDERRGATSLPPQLVVVVSLSKDVDTTTAVDLLKEADLSSQVNISPQNVCHVSACKLKKRMSVLVPDYMDLQSVLDAAKVADVLLFLVGEDGMDRYGEHCLSCIIGQGVPAHLFACQGLTNLSKKKLSDAKKRIEKQIVKSFPGDKLRTIDNWQDAQTIFRQISNLAPKPVHFRDSRPYLLAEKLEFEPRGQDDMQSIDEGEEDHGTLKVSGYLRGQRLDVNQLIHLPGWGDFQMEQIDESDDPYPLSIKGNKDRRQKKGEVTDTEMKEAVPTSICLAKATNPESLQSEVIPDAMDQEQTWPTPEELGEDKPTKVKSLKGVSDYQSNWILDMDDAEDGSDDSGDDDDEHMEDDMAPARLQQQKEGEDEGEEEEDDGPDAMTSDGADTANYDAQMDMDEEKQMYERMKEERLHVHFPDEIDTPIDTAARVRFARYRGMDSFQTSPWDPNDCLPFDYARIYRVSKHHYKRLRKISMKEREEGDGDNLMAEPGTFITVHVKNVPKAFMESHKPGVSVTLFGLFSNEQKMTLVSTLISRVSGFKAPVKAKDPLVFQIGFRRFSACPIFSEHAYQNKFKMERYLPQSGFVVASMFAPIMFAPAPVLVFRENVLSKYDLVAKGSVLPLDTNRIVIKRVVLSGAPFKINKKSVVVRYMFFNREDIDFYKPVELKTKYGKRGHIRQALGTHGHMKCTFNGQLKSEDTVLMNLYKRVFPKWSYDPLVSILPPNIEEERGKEEEEEEIEDMTEETEDKPAPAYMLFD